MVASPLSVQLESGEVELTERTDHVVRRPAQHASPGLLAPVFTLPVLDQPGCKLRESGLAGQLLSAPALKGTKYFRKVGDFR